MSEKLLQALRTIQTCLKENEPRVLRQFAESGIEPDPAVVYSCAIYYDTLRKLAQE